MTTHANTGLHGAARLQPLTQGSRLQRKMILIIGALVCLAIHAHPSSLGSAAEFEPIEPIAETKIGRIERFVAAEPSGLATRSAAEH